MTRARLDLDLLWDHRHWTLSHIVSIERDWDTRADCLYNIMRIVVASHAVVAKDSWLRLELQAS